MIRGAGATYGKELVSSWKGVAYECLETSVLRGLSMYGERWMTRLALWLAISGCALLGASCERVPLGRDNALKNDTLACLITNGAVYCRGTHDLDSGYVECFLRYPNHADMAKSMRNLRRLGWMRDDHASDGISTNCFRYWRVRTVPYSFRSREQLDLRQLEDGLVHVTYY